MHKGSRRKKKKKQTKNPMKATHAKKPSNRQYP